MAFGTFASGPYTATYNSNAIGLVEGVRRMRRTNEGADIRADLYAQTVIGSVYQGGQCFVSMVLKEWTANNKDLIWPFDTTDFGSIGEPMGRLYEDLAKSLVLTAVAGTPAATNGPATITFSKAILAPQNDVEVIMGSEERNVPILFRCYPYYDASSSKVVWFTET